LQLFSTTYGVGDGSTTFNVPDLEDNVTICGSSVANSKKPLAQTGGANTVTPTGNVAGSTANATLSTDQLASHAHSGAAGMGTATTGGCIPVGMTMGSTGSTGSGQGHSHNMSANFAGDANSVLQPFLTLIYIIKT
jgi:microcystin-dependent protein